MSRRSTIAGLLTDARQAVEMGRAREAIKAIDEVLARDPAHAEALELAGMAALAQDRPADAVRHLRRAVEADASTVRRMRLAIALRASGDTAGALDQLKTALAGDARAVPVLLLAADLLHETGDLEGAADAYGTVLSLEPRNAQARMGLAKLAEQRGDPDSAMAHLRAATENAPDDAATWDALSLLALGRNEPALAIQALNRALSLNPGSAALLMRLCEAYARRDGGKGESRLSEAALEALYDVLAVLLRAGFTAQTASGFAEIARRNPDQVRARSQLVFLSNYTSAADPMTTVLEAKALGDALPRADAPARWWPAADDPERRLRVGLVSDDFRFHVVRHFLLGFLKHVDRSRIEFFGYSSTQIQDAFTAQYKQVIRNWFDAETTGDADLAQRIAADRIDILIDLGGHTQRPRIGVFARRPAPVQVTWLGYSGTTGVGEIDYILGDRFVTPEGSAGQFSETPWPLPDAYLSYDPHRLDIPVKPPPSLESRRVTFGSLNLLAKVSDETVALWSRVLAAVPRSRMLVKSNALDDVRHADATRARFQDHGIGADRLVLIGNQPDPVMHLSTYNRIDVALDPFPYNGTTTTAEALWMGVPVLTLRGDRFIARVGESIVTSVGHPEWVAAEQVDLVTKAVRLAADGKRLARLRAGLRAEMLASPLCDGRRFARSFEAALRGMWAKRCADGAR